MRNIFNPVHLADRSWIWLTVSLLIPVIGVLFLKWSLFSLLLLFWFELKLIGIFGLLRILFSLQADLITRIISMVFFGVLYGGLAMLIIAFSMTELDFDSLFANFGNKATGQMGVAESQTALVIVFVMEFLRDFLLSSKYKITHPFTSVFRTIVYALPLAVVVLFVILPLSKKVPLAQLNLVVVLGIVLSKTLIEFMVLKIGSRIQIDVDEEVGKNT